MASYSNEPHDTAYMLPLLRMSSRLQARCAFADPLLTVRLFPNHTVLEVTHGQHIVDFLNALYGDADLHWKYVGPLAQLFAPHDPIYLTDPSCEELCLRSALQKGNGVLAWQDLPPSSKFRKTASFSVSFYVRCEVPYSAWDFARFLLFYIRTYSPSFQTRQKAIAHFAYSLRPDGIYGVLLCGTPLRHAFEAVQLSGTDDPQSNFVCGVPVTTWPLNTPYMKLEYRVMIALRFARLLGLH
ncbi:hypothetical protein JVT61DRAFT_12545 [Boletus reticuloceps]|uniref:Uncharacterized protein n=1 Tax=Boletus reticuloceps TaxID=495285 RepID=A0A8I3A3V7_9AGAM|nr:hypothetical protein JVT61DRAFT_12545 [Boletus reticuloceps]